MNSDKINKEYWEKVEPEKILSGTVFPGRELMKYLKSGDNILDVGCGAGKVSSYLFEKGYRVTGIDINKEALKEGKKINKDIIYKKADITKKIPFADNFFDAVIVFDVFEHIENDHQAVREAYRVLKKGGTLFFIVPAFQILFSSHDKALNHQRRYSRKNLTELLRPFDQTTIYFWNFILREILIQ